MSKHLTEMIVDCIYKSKHQNEEENRNKNNKLTYVETIKQEFDTFTM